MSATLTQMDANAQNEFQAAERGNALIYVLIAIALFAALSMTLGRQTDSGEAGALSDEKAELYAVQLINYAAQAKSAVDQMLFSGGKIDSLVFTLPTQAGFNTPPNGNKIYHPSGGGLSPGRIGGEAAVTLDADPPAGWYMGRFNNVDWTKTAGQDVFLAAYQINKKICAKINEKITGTDAIPAITGAARTYFVDDDFHGGTNADLVTDPDDPSPICTDCYKKTSLCVKNQSDEIYTFYTLLADQ